MSRKTTTPASTLRLRADLALLLTAVIWGSAFVAQRIAAPTAGVFLFNGLRFFLGALVLLPLVWRSTTSPRFARPQLPWLAAGGLLLFTAGGLQQAGLQYTTAGNAGFITGLYVVIVPLILWLVWRQHIRLVAWVAAGMATLGVLLLSAQGKLTLAPGDGLELAGALFWALHVIVVGRAVQRMDIIAFSVGQFLLAGLLNLAVGMVAEADLWAEVARAWPAVVYTGVLSVGAGYTLQAIGQKHAPAHEAAILLSTEAVFAALAGYAVLGEQLAPIQLLGCAVILAAIVLTVWTGAQEQSSSPGPG